jgi:hypothetical protein
MWADARIRRSTTNIPDPPGIVRRSSIASTTGANRTGPGGAGVWVSPTGESGSLGHSRLASELLRSWSLGVLFGRPELGRTIGFESRPATTASHALPSTPPGVRGSSCRTTSGGSSQRRSIADVGLAFRRPVARSERAPVTSEIWPSMVGPFA